MPKRGPSPLRRFVVSPSEAGRAVGELLHRRFGYSWPAARGLIGRGHVRVDGRPCRNPSLRVRTGQRLEIGAGQAAQGSPPPHQPRRPRRPDRGTPPENQVHGVRIRFADSQVVVVEKPAGLTTMRHPEEVAEFGARARRYLPPTLADLLPGLLRKGPGRPLPRLRAVHRLDRDTSGLVVFARTPEAEGSLGKQFRGHTIDRRYLAVVRGRPAAGRIESALVRDRGDGRRGSSDASGAGKRAVTHVRVLEELGDYTLVECRLETGRTHQVRIHLGENGTPICGERVYDRPVHGKPVPDGSGSPRLALHAAELGFHHPQTGKHLVWKSALPEELANLVARLRKRAGPASNDSRRPNS